MLIEVEVTQMDAYKGDPGDPVRCAVGRAINRRILSAKYCGAAARVGNRTVYIDGRTIDLPPEATSYIYAYDRRRSRQRYPKPITFTLDIPDDVII